MGSELLLYHAAYLGVTLLLVQSLNLVWKARMFSLGHHGFFAVGAYAAVVATRLALRGDAWNLEGISSRFFGLALLAACVVAGACAAGAVGWIVGGPFTRLAGDYFAVATIVFAEIVRGVAANWPFVGGGLGFEVPYLVLDRGGRERLGYGLFYAAVLAGLNLAAFTSIRRIDRSIYGLYLAAVDDDPIAAELSGIDVRRLQRLVLVLGAAGAGAAGAVFLHFTTIIVPADFSFINGLPIVLAVVLGAKQGSRCVLAAAFIYASYEIIKLRFFGLFGTAAGALIADWKEALLGIVLVLAAVLPAVWRRKRRAGEAAPASRPGEAVAL